jgi:membrane-associated phospholipid phosphatase
MSAGMYFIGKGTGNKKARETGFLGALAIGHAQLLTQGLKYMTQRERPLDYKEANHGGIAFFRGGDSFPSGHSSSSFALAAVFSYEYGRDHKWVPFTSYGLATVIAASRLSGQKHWMSDIFVGSTMGFLVGRYVYKHHHDPRIDGVNPRLSDRIVPQFGLTSKGLTLLWQL